MCVRTKTSYDCGCVFKTTNECDIPGCVDLDRYHYMKDGDCQNCKSAGIDGTRGREGKGRYAQEMKRSRTKDRPHQSQDQISPSSSLDDVSPTSTAGTSPITHEIGGGTSPWVPSRGRQKPWETPHRKRADEAWLSEHEDRLSDLQERFETCTLSNHTEPKTPSRRYVYEPEEYNRWDDDQISTKDLFQSPRRPLQIEGRERLTGGPSRQSHLDDSPLRQDRQYSDESLPDSMPSYRSSPHAKSHSVVQHTFSDNPLDYDFYTSGYGSLKHPTKKYPSGSKTEPNVYTRSPYSYDDYTLPMSNPYSPKYHRRSSRRHNIAEPGGQQHVRYRPTY